MTPADLAAWQTRLGLTQVEAAQKLKMPVQTYRNLLKGRRHAAALPEAIALLCQLVEEPNRQAGTASVLHLVLNVSADEIAALDQTLLVELLRRLLHTEAESHGLVRSGITVPAQINVADGGEDGRIQWTGGAEHTGFLPSRLVQFQAKAADMPPAKCAAEMLEKVGSIKELIRSSLEAGGTYVIFCNRPCTRKMIDSRISRMREAVNAESPDLGRVAKLDFWDANRIADWANAHYPVALWVIEHVRPGGILPFQTLERWGQDRRVSEFQFVNDKRVESISSEIEKSLDQPKGVLRLTGLSGLGKTRLAYESLHQAPLTTRARILYVHGEFGGERILGVVQAIREYGKSAIIVVDDCPPELHKALAAIVEHASSRLSLLTIDFDPTPLSPDSKSISIPRADDKVVIDIIRQGARGVADIDVDRLARFAQGFPQIAVLIAQTWPFATHGITALTDAELIRRMVFGRRQARQDLLTFTEVLSLFDTVRVNDEDLDELEVVASMARVDVDTAYRFVQELLDRGIAQRRGRFVQVQPKPLALALAASAWKAATDQQIQRLAVGAIPARLRAALFIQFAKLDGVERARQIAERLCLPGQPFATPEFLDDELHAQCLGLIAEVNPGAALDALEHAFADVAAADLRKLTRGRRWLIWTLEKLCFPEETFERAATLLLAFAVAENEKGIGNNATAMFQQLFKLYLAGTEMPAIKRLSILDGALASNDAERRRIAVAALKQGLETWHFSRSGGAEQQGLRPSLQDWKPSVKAEVVDYYRACLNRLLDVACGQDELRSTAKECLASRIRGLIGSGLVDEVTTMARRIVASEDPYWPNAIEQVEMSLNYDGAAMSDAYREKVVALHEMFKPRSFAHRLRLYICELPWGCHEHGKNGADSGSQWAAVFARECAERWSEFLQLLPMLSKGEQRNTYMMGRDIVGHVADVQGLIDVVLSNLREVPRQERNAALLGGVIAAADKLNPVLVDRTLDRVAADTESIAFLPWLTAQTTIELRDLERIVDGVRRGNLSPHQVRILAMGGVLTAVPSTDVAFLTGALLEAQSGGYWAAVEILGMYVFQNPARREELKATITQVIAAFSIERLKDGGSAMDGHHFHELASWVIRHGGSDSSGAGAAIKLAEEAMRYCLEPSDSYHERQVIERILPELFAHCACEIWPTISTCIELNRDKLWRFEGMLRVYCYDGKVIKSPVFSVPWDKLRAWYHKNPTFAPAFLMRFAPTLAIDAAASAGADGEPEIDDSTSSQQSKRWSPIVLRLLDDFGDRQDVLEALGANMVTFTWSGSLVPYFEQYLGPLQTLASHHRPAVAAWAKRQLQAQRETVRHEQSREEEREFGVY